jgi:hypothetical protein
VEPLELPRLTTDGLIRTACDPFPLDTLPLPAEDRPPEVPAAAPLLLPLNRCHPPAPDCEAEPVEGDPVVDGPRLIADVLPDDVDEGFTRCQLPVAPVEVPVDPLLCTAAGVAADRAAPLLPAEAERVIACLC